MLLPECTTARAKESPMPWSKPAHSPFGRAHCTVVCRWLSECDSASVDYMLAEWQRIGGLEYMLAENLVELRHGGRQKGDQHRHAHLQNEG